MQILKNTSLIALVLIQCAVDAVPTIARIKQNAVDAAREALHILVMAQEKEDKKKESDFSEDEIEEEYRRLEEIFKELDDCTTPSDALEPEKYEQEEPEFDQEMLDKLYSMRDYPWLREFAKCASAEAVLLVAKKNPILCEMQEALEKIFSLDAAVVTHFLVEHKELLPHFAKMASDEHVLHVAKIEKDLKEDLSMRVRLLRIEKARSRRTQARQDELDKAIHESPQRLPLYKDPKRYYRQYSQLHYGVPDAIKETKSQHLFQGLKQIRDGLSQECGPESALESFIDTYAQHKEDPRVVEVVGMLIENAPDSRILALAEHLEPEHLAACFELMDRHLIKPDAWNDLENRLLKLQESGESERLCLATQSAVARKANRIRTRRDRAVTCAAVLKKFLKYGYGERSSYCLILKLAQEVKGNEHLAADLENIFPGEQKS